jgi:hypothetical protein
MTETIISLTILSLIFLKIANSFKKRRLKKAQANPIQLENLDIMRMGPFSGSCEIFKKSKSMLLLCAFSFAVQADVTSQTLSDWEIDDLDEDTLIVAKSSEQIKSSKSIIGFHVSRPHCFAENPIMMLRSELGDFYEGDKVKGEMIVDKNKPKKLLLRHEFSFVEEDEAVNWFKLMKFPSFAEAETVQVKFKSQSPLSTTIFDTTGIERARYQAEQICQSGQSFRQVKKGDKV